MSNSCMGKAEGKCAISMHSAADAYVYPESLSNNVVCVKIMRGICTEGTSIYLYQENYS